MSFNASSYFAGVGTVVVVMVVGFSAGMQMTGLLDDPYQPNKLERRALGIVDKLDDVPAPEARTAIKSSPETRAAPEIKAPAETRTAPSVTAPDLPKATAQSEPAPMAPSQRMRQSFDWQPGASPPPQTTARSALQPAASPPAASAPASAPAAAPQTTPQAAPEPSSVAAQPAMDANAAARDAEAEKAKAAADQKKAQQRRVATARKRERDREARLNAAAEWLRGQPANVYAGQRNAFAEPRIVRRDPFRW